MNKILYLISICFLISCTHKLVETKEKTVDVCVYGGTSSGVIAAYSASKLGKSVILIEPGKYLGGMTTGGLGKTDIGNKQAITGLSRLFYKRIGEYYNKAEQWLFPPSVASKVMNQYVEEVNMDVVYQYRIVQVSKNGTQINKINLESSNYPNTFPKMEIKAKQFIDCSYEGDLMAKAKVSYTVGRESSNVYGESYNGVHVLGSHQFPDGVDPYKVEGDSTSGYCWGISNGKLKPTGSGDSLVQAYNFRLCLTTKKDNQVPFLEPKNYDASKYELLGRALRKMEPDINKVLLIGWTMPDEKYDVNNRGPLSTDMIGMSSAYPEADYVTRTKIWKSHVDYTKGLFYYLSHDEAVPDTLRKQVLKLGWAKDEFVDNNNFPTQLYIREARRMIGEYVMTQHNCQGDSIIKDSIGLAAYTMDSHNCQRIVINGMVKNEGDVQIGGFPPYPISYRSITPKREECTNLLVPVCLSASHIAYGSIRMEPVFMVLGQSAGIAASMSIDEHTAVQKIDIKALIRLLKENPYLYKK